MGVLNTVDKSSNNIKTILGKKKNRVNTFNLIHIHPSARLLWRRASKGCESVGFVQCWLPGMKVWQVALSKKRGGAPPSGGLQVDPTRHQRPDLTAALKL